MHKRFAFKNFNEVISLTVTEFIEITINKVY